MRFASRTTALLLVAVLLAACSGGPAGPYPEREVELVVPFPAGGGSDTLARMLAHILEDERLVPSGLRVVNRPGAGGGEGLTHVAGRRGDAHTLLTVNDSIVTVPLQPGYRGPTHRDLTIIAILARDDFLVVVPVDSPHRTVGGLLEYASANPGRLKLATAAAGGEDHIFGYLLEKAAYAQFSYVHADGGSAAIQLVLTGQADLAVPNPNEVLQQLQAGQVRALAVGSDTRLHLLPQVPTLRESGYDVVFHMFRGVAGPPQMPVHAVRYWEQALVRVAGARRWREEYLERLGLTPALVVGRAAARTVEDAAALYRRSLKELGFTR
jgi:putative tricarboxylic transport membrane protein